MLYFTYSAMLDPDLLQSVAPNAKFLYIAHLPEAKLTFPTPDGRPSVQPAPGHTVWGAIFEVSSKEAAAIEKAESSEGRKPRTDLRAVDRAGNKYDVVTFSHPAGDGDHTPDSEYLERVVKGARHWNLPTGWVAGLEDLGEDALI
ncbi:MAG: gamma-glutamylcyclotransferase family protein [Acidimicrobiia bacterium]